MFNSLGGHTKHRIIQSGLSECLYEVYTSPEISEMNCFSHPEILDIARWNVMIRHVYRWWLQVVDIACMHRIRGIEAVMQILNIERIRHGVLDIVSIVRQKVEVSRGREFVWGKVTSSRRQRVLES